MFLLIVSLVVVLPLIELYVIVQVGHQVGLLPTIALLIAISAVGTSLVKREGMRVFKEFTQAIQQGEEPSKQIVHGVCILAAGVFLFAPRIHFRCSSDNASLATNTGYRHRTGVAQKSSQDHSDTRNTHGTYR